MQQALAQCHIGRPTTNVEFLRNNSNKIKHFVNEQIVHTQYIDRITNRIV